MNKSKNKRRKKKNLKGLTLALLAVICVFAIIGIGLVGGSLFGFVEGTELLEIDNMRLNLTTFVYAEDSSTGEMVEVEQLYDDENRIWVSSSKIPENLKNAFISIEDERFYSHCGFDIKRLTGAVIQYITNKGKSSYGGSTITQQLIKNITKDDDYSVKRKIQEIYRAYNLERQLSKDEILEYYLNTIYLSRKCNGVASAAQTYFGKDVSKLSLAECATIAGITQFPSKYDPISNPENNKQRQLVILKKMYELGHITKAEYEDAKVEELKFAITKDTPTTNIQSYYTDAAIEQIVNDLVAKYNYTKEYASKILYNGGLKIYLSMDTSIQEKLDEIYQDDSNFQKSSKATQPQSSMVIMDPYTGEVKALIGGRGEKDANRTLNRATQTLRQPGSTIKPLSVYSPAVEYGLVEPSSLVNDSPVEYGDWAPRNDDRAFQGRITVAAALRGSRNVPAVKICDYLTPQASFDFVSNNYHISTLVESEKRNGKVFTDVGLSQIALGGLTDGVSVLEMCAAYCAFPNGGTYIKPSLYTRVLDSEGNVLLEHSSKGVVAISQTTAEAVTQMLTDAVNGGTGTAARLSKMPVAGKTGTTSSNNDRWFVGYTPYYVGAVWFGYDQPASLKGFSPNPAAVAWRKVMAKVHEELPNKKFFSDLDKNSKNIMICADSGKRATPSCTKLKSKSYKNSKVPEKYCTEHEYAFNEDKLLAGAELIEKDENVEGIIDEETGDIVFDEETGTIPPNPTDDTTPGPMNPPASADTGGGIVVD